MSHMYLCIIDKSIVQINFAGIIIIDELTERVQAFAVKELANAGAPEKSTDTTKNDKVW